MRLTGLFLYPVKSLRGFAVPSVTVDALGPVGDRRFLIVDDQGGFLTQRGHPRMALIATELTATDLVLRAEGVGEISVPLRAAEAAPAHRVVTIWRSRDLLAEDCGAAVDTWLSAFLGFPCHLVRIGEKFRRPVLERPPYTSAPPDAPLVDGRIVASDLFTFADGFPFLVVSEASLANLNDHLVTAGAEPVPMDRFRPTLVLSGCEAFAEDQWSRVRVGALTLRSGGPCARCIVTTTDQLTGERGKEPLRTLAAYRRDAIDPTRINFGLNLTHETKSGTLRLGDSVTVL